MRRKTVLSLTITLGLLFAMGATAMAFHGNGNGNWPPKNDNGHRPPHHQKPNDHKPPPKEPPKPEQPPVVQAPQQPAVIVYGGQGGQVLTQVIPSATPPAATPGQPLQTQERQPAVQRELPEGQEVQAAVESVPAEAVRTAQVSPEKAVAAEKAQSAPQQAEKSQKGGLPFSGFDLISILVVGMLLLGLGLVLRRLTHDGTVRRS